VSKKIEKVIRQSISQSYERIVANQQGLFEGRDPEAVHQARVATRRLRSDLRTFSNVLDDEQTKHLRAELRWLGADLGAVRDVEVMLDRLETHAAQLPEPEADAVDHALRRMRADRTAARAALLSSLRSPRYAQLRRALASATLNPPLSKKARSAGRKELRRAVEKRWKKLRKSVKRLGNTPSDAALHAVRKRAKQCRYAAEACAPVFGRPADRLGEALARVQDELGEQHDSVVAIGWLAKSAQESPSGEAYALGRLAQIEADAAREAVDDFRTAWRRARRSKLRTWIS